MNISSLSLQNAPSAFASQPAHSIENKQGNSFCEKFKAMLKGVTNSPLVREAATAFKDITYAVSKRALISLVEAFVSALAKVEAKSLMDIPKNLASHFVSDFALHFRKNILGGGLLGIASKTKLAYQPSR